MPGQNLDRQQWNDMAGDHTRSQSMACSQEFKGVHCIRQPDAALQTRLACCDAAPRLVRGSPAVEGQGMCMDFSYTEKHEQTKQPKAQGLWALALLHVGKPRDVEERTLEKACTDVNRKA